MGSATLVGWLIVQEIQFRIMRFMTERIAVDIFLTKQMR